MITVLRDASAPASQSYLPKMYTFTAAGEFVPLKGPGYFPGHGSRAARFTDIGLKWIGDHAGQIYLTNFKEWSGRTKGVKRLKAKSITVPRR